MAKVYLFWHLCTLISLLSQRIQSFVGRPVSSLKTGPYGVWYMRLFTNRWWNHRVDTSGERQITRKLGTCQIFWILSFETDVLNHSETFGNPIGSSIFVFKNPATFWRKKLTPAHGWRILLSSNPVPFWHVYWTKKSNTTRGSTSKKRSDRPQKESLCIDVGLLYFCWVFFRHCSTLNQIDANLGCTKSSYIPGNEVRKIIDSKVLAGNGYVSSLGRYTPGN